MKKYKLIRGMLFGGAMTVLLSGVGCNIQLKNKSSDRIADELNRRCVVWLNDNIRIVDKKESINVDDGCSNDRCLHYQDIISNEIYTNSFECDLADTHFATVCEIGGIIDFLTVNQIKAIMDGNFNDEDWIVLFKNISLLFQEDSNNFVRVRRING